MDLAARRRRRGGLERRWPAPSWLLLEQILRAAGWPEPTDQTRARAERADGRSPRRIDEHDQADAGRDREQQRPRRRTGHDEAMIGLGIEYVRHEDLAVVPVETDHSRRRLFFPQRVPAADRGKKLEGIG